MVIFLYKSVKCLKSVNHNKKILDLAQPTANWFRDAICYSGIVGLCSPAYITINHDMQVTFAKRWHSKTSFFHLPLGEMTIILDDISFLLHLPIRKNYWTTKGSVERKSSR